jgi:putative spermidine/putrescine transport system permease protein
MGANMLPASKPFSVGLGKRIAPWLGVAPFFVFSALFLILPTALLLVGAFQNAEGQFTLQNIANLSRPDIVKSFKLSLEISAASAFAGAVLGFALAYAAIIGGLPKLIRPILMTFSGVASNFAGVPLAFAFIATLGRLGLVTVFLNNLFGFNISSAGFNLLDFWGLTLVYLYFQIPLMVLILAPAIDGLKMEWREASATLGSSTWQHWRYVTLPILWPSLAGATLLLFANAFGAVATAFALTNSSLNIVPILLFAQIRGDVLHDPNLGYALAFGMVLITGFSNILYIMLRARAERWQK